MRLQLAFRITKKEMPKDYRKYFLSYIKHAIMVADEELYQQIYEKTTVMKPFTFAIYMEQPKFTKEKIIVATDRITMNISFYDMAFGIRYYNGFVQQLHQNFKIAEENTLVLERIHMVKEETAGREICLRTLSPIILREHKGKNKDDRYLLYEEESFLQGLKENIETGMTRITNIEEEKIHRDVEALQVEIGKMKKVVIPHFSNKIGSYIDGNIGAIAFRGEPYILDYLYKAGVGSRRSQGFGMMDIV